MTSRAEVRRATAADLEAFFGGPVGPTVMAWVGLVDGKPVALGGLKYLAGKPYDLFLDVREEARRRPLELVRLSRAVLRELGDIPARAVADPAEPKSGKLLTLLGLRRIGTAQGMEVFRTWPA